MLKREKGEREREGERGREGGRERERKRGREREREREGEGEGEGVDFLMGAHIAILNTCTYTYMYVVTHFMYTVLQPIPHYTTEGIYTWLYLLYVEGHSV